MDEIVQPVGALAEVQSINQNGGEVKVNKKGFLEMFGEVSEVLPAGAFRIKLDNGHELLCHLSGKMRLNRIHLVPGDRVQVEISSYDLTKGRITFRL